jgi:tRNA threonylcarbamoyl adenosine modification protein YeaZ
MDCSGPVGSVAVTHGGEVLFERRFDCPRGRGGAVFEALEQAASEVGKIDRVVVGIGPGSYNGLRVTAAAGEGLAAAWDAERVGILSVAGLHGGGEFFAAGDARGGSFYLVRVRRGIPCGEIRVLNEADLLEAVSFAPELPVLVPSAISVLPQAVIGSPDAVLLANAGAYLAPVVGIEPCYIKPVHITAPRVRS